MLLHLLHSVQAPGAQGYMESSLLSPDVILHGSVTYELNKTFICLTHNLPTPNVQYPSHLKSHCLHIISLTLHCQELVTGPDQTAREVGIRSLAQEEKEFYFDEQITKHTM